MASKARRSRVTQDYTKVHNGERALSAKAKIRLKVLEQISPASAHVFDAYAGPGQMYAEAWCRAHTYVGCDREAYADSRLMFCADSARVMRAIDLQPFNVFDFDAFGSPYEQVIILTVRRTVAPGELIGVVLTDGTELQMKLNAFPHAVAQLANLKRGQVGVALNADLIMNRIVAGIARNMNCEIVKRWQVESSGPTRKASAGGILMRYVGLVLKGR